MAFADELLEQAQHLAERDKTRPRQVNLRRAVSNAYYALFHFLCEQVASNWRNRRQRRDFARLLQHGHMRQICDGLSAKKGPLPPVESKVQQIAARFVELQQLRHTADYDGGRSWSRSETQEAIRSASLAIVLWPEIANEPAAQDYLLSLLMRERR